MAYPQPGGRAKGDHPQATRDISCPQLDPKALRICPLKAHVWRPIRQLLHTLHRLEHSRLCVHRPLGYHLGVNLTDREHRPTLTRGKRG